MSFELFRNENKQANYDIPYFDRNDVKYEYENIYLSQYLEHLYAMRKISVAHITFKK